MLLIIGYDSRTKTLLPTIYDSLFLIFCHIVFCFSIRKDTPFLGEYKKNARKFAKPT